MSETLDCGLPDNDPACTTPDIRIKFGFDVCGNLRNVLSCAYLPLPGPWTIGGDIRFEEARRWAYGAETEGVDLVSAAAHEIGHAIGLGHAPPSECPNRTLGESAIMCPFYRRPHRFLAEHDIEAVQALYGTVPPGTCNDDPGADDYATFPGIRCEERALLAELRAGVSTSLAQRLSRRLLRARRGLDLADARCVADARSAARSGLSRMRDTIVAFSRVVTAYAAGGGIPLATAQGFAARAASIVSRTELKLAEPSPCSGP
jgi:hypothetical protein